MALLYRRSACSRRYRQPFRWAFLLLLLPRSAGADCQLCGCTSCQGEFPLGNPEAEVTFTPAELTPTLLDAVQQLQNLGIVVNCAFLEQALQQEPATENNNNNASSECDALQLSSRIRTLCECLPLDADGIPIPPAEEDETDTTPTTTTTTTTPTMSPRVRQKASWDFILTMVLLSLAAVLFIAGTLPRWMHWRSNQQPSDRSGSRPESEVRPASSLIPRWIQQHRRTQQQPASTNGPPQASSGVPPSFLVPQSIVEQREPHQHDAYAARTGASDLEEAIYQSTLEAAIAQSKADFHHTLLELDL